MGPPDLGQPRCDAVRGEASRGIALRCEAQRRTHAYGGDRDKSKRHAQLPINQETIEVCGGSEPPHNRRMRRISMACTEPPQTAAPINQETIGASEFVS